MKGKTHFTKTEVDRIRELLRAKSHASRAEQKVLRQKIRDTGFFISDFGSSCFSVIEFENLIKTGSIKIAENAHVDTSANISVFSSSKSLQTEEVRRRYKPTKTKILFVGESPPVGGKFFYLVNSNLYRCIRDAFTSVYNGKCGEGEEFLQFFSIHHCYLDDLCLEAVNGKSDSERKRLRSEGIEPLAQRIRAIRPEVVVTVMKSIKSEVCSAIQSSGVVPIIVKTTTFPSFSDSNKKTCISDMTVVLNQLIEAKILARD